MAYGKHKLLPCVYSAHVTTLFIYNVLKVKAFQKAEFCKPCWPKTRPYNLASLWKNFHRVFSHGMCGYFTPNVCEGYIGLFSYVDSVSQLINESLLFSLSRPTNGNCSDNPQYCNSSYEFNLKEIQVAIHSHYEMTNRKVSLMQSLIPGLNRYWPSMDRRAEWYVTYNLYLGASTPTSRFYDPHTNPQQQIY